MKHKRKPRSTPRPQDAAARRAAGTPAATENGRLWLFGLHPVAAALENPARRWHRLLATAEAGRALMARVPATAAAQVEARGERVGRAEIDALLPPGTVHQGVALLADPLEPPALEALCAGWAAREEALVVVLDQPNDPHNIGAVLRSAAAFGAEAVIVPERGTPEETGVVAKAACGALERIALVRVVNLARALKQLKDAGFWCSGLDAHTDRTLLEADLGGKVALVLGAEGSGLRRLTRETCDFLFTIPMSGDVESLNLSNATAVALYEAARRRLARS